MVIELDGGAGKLLPGENDTVIDEGDPFVVDNVDGFKRVVVWDMRGFDSAKQIVVRLLCIRKPNQNANIMYILKACSSGHDLLSQFRTSEALKSSGEVGEMVL